MNKAFTLTVATHVDTFTWFRKRFPELGRRSAHTRLFTWIRKSCPAFTFAEVLVTLGIIGVVVAMTLPTVINNAKNKQLETALKRSYSALAQALDMYQAENGERVKAAEIGRRELKPILMKYISTARDCGWGIEENDCIFQSYSDPTKETSDLYKTYNGLANVQLVFFDEGQFVMNDGSLVLLENANLENRGGLLLISVDVNGYNKRPNRLGHDLFMFEIDRLGRFLPMGVTGTLFYDPGDTYCGRFPDTLNDMNGAGCTYKALTEKDYFKNLPR